MAISQVSNVIVAGNGDSIPGLLRIREVKLVAGIDAASATLSIGSVTVWASGSVAAGAASAPDKAVINVPAGSSLSVATTGTAPTLIIYLL